MNLSLKHALEKLANILKKSKFQWISFGLVSFFAGSITMSIVATVQRVIFNMPIVPKWYFIPVTVGGCIGLVVGIWSKKIRIYSKKLIISEERFQDLFLHAPIAYQCLDDKGIIQDVNQTFLDMIEYARYDIISRPFTDFLNPNSIPKFNDHLDTIKHDTIFPLIELELVKNDGTVLIVELECRPNINNLGHIDKLYCVLKDVTKSKKSDKILKENEELYRTLFYDANDAILIMKDARFIECNKKTLEIFKCAREQIINKTLMDFSPEFQNDGKLTKDKALKLIEKAINGESQLFEWLHKDLNENIFDAQISLNRIVFQNTPHLLAIVRDVTDSKQMAENLKIINKSLVDLGTDFGQNFNKLTALCGNLLDATCCTYIRIKNDLMYTVGKWNLPENIPHETLIEGSLCNKLLKTDQDWLFIPDINPQEINEKSIVKTLNIKSYFGHKIKSSQKIIGVLCVFHNESFHPDDYEKNMLGIISSAISVEEARRIAQEALKESEERFKAIFNGVNDAVFIHDPENGNILAVNQTVYDMYGFSPNKIEQITLEKISSGITPYTQEYALRWFQKTMTDQVTEFEWQAKHKSGSLFWVDVTMKKVCIAGSDLIVAAVRDISDKKQANKALKESELKYRSLLTQLPVGIYRRAYGKSSKMLLANPAIYKMLGYHSFKEFMSSESSEYQYDTEKWDQLNALLSEKGKVDDYEVTLKRKDGTPAHCKVWATLVKDENTEYVDGILVDITKQKQTEEENTRLAKAIEQASEVVIITDTQGTMLYVNPAFEKISGYSKDEAIGQNPRILKSGKHDDEYYRNMWNTITSGKTWKSKVINKAKSGTFYTEEVEISPIRDENGNITNYVSVNHDITRELELEGQIRQSQKMEAIGQLAGGVAHDFNNMLQVIAGYTELSLNMLDDDNPAKKSLYHVAKASERATALVRQLLAFSRRETLQLEQIDINDLTTGLLKMIRRILGEHIELSFHPKADLQTVQADPGQIEQILLNLCVNARDAMPEGGKLSIETDNAILSKEYCSIHNDAKEGNYVLLSVSDSGKGIPKHIQDRIFEPFFTTKAVGDGTGLGLSTVYAITRRHEGFINLYSEEGIGTVFKVYLPITNYEIQEKSDKQQKKEILQGTGETILIAEDDEQVRELAELILEHAGYRILTAKDGEDAITIFENHKSEIDLVLLDVVMPKKSGRVVHDHIRAMNPDIPILFASGYSHDILDTGHLPEGGYNLVRKPYDQSGLLNPIREALGSRKKNEN